MDFNKIPVMDRQSLRDLKKGIDQNFKEFSREYGDGIESFFDPLLSFLIWLEKLLVGAPWPIVIFAFGFLAWVGSRSYKLALGTVLSFLVIGYFGMWKNCMATVAIISVATLVCIAVGIPIGILMSKSNRAEKAILPILDMMQTIPSFVYLIPIIMLLGIGKVPGLLAVCVYALPPIVRLTNLGIREVDKETLEASEAFGATTMQKLRTVQIPLSLPTIFAGVNQTIMMALAMVVIASMIGTRGLGDEVLLGLQQLNVGRAAEAGIAIVLLAIVLDRITQSYGETLQERTAPNTKKGK